MLGMGGATAYGNNGLYDPKKTYTNDGTLIEGWYDVNGHMVAYINLTVTNSAENGRFQLVPSPSNTAGPYRYINSTDSYATYDQNNGTMSTDLWQGGFSLTSAIGLMAIIGAVMAIGVIAGIHFFGTGLADESVSLIIKGSALVTVWLVFSAISLALITSIPLLGPIFYFFLTIVYTLGIINQVGHPGED